MSRINTDRALDTRNLGWDPEKQSFAEEASTARYTGSYRLYDDACDFGIWVRSHRTNRLVPFLLKQTQEDSEGEVLAFHFEGWDCSSNLSGLPLTLFND